MMWYHGQDTDWEEEGEGVMDIGTGRCVRRSWCMNPEISPHRHPCNPTPYPNHPFPVHTP